MIPKNLICYQSAFFNAAFNGSFIEGETQEMNLGDVEGDIFAMVVKWMYQGEILQGELDCTRWFFRKLITDSDNNVGLADNHVPLVDLAKLWDLADRLMMPMLQNMVMEELPQLDRSKLVTLTKSGDNNPEVAVREFLEYVGLSRDCENPLGRYCIRLLLRFFKDKYEKDKDDAKEHVRTMLGDGLLTGFILFLMEQVEFNDEVYCEGFYVEY